MGIISTDKFVNVDSMQCDEEVIVTLSLTASPDITDNPAEIILLLDRSGSMQGEPLEDMKIAAKAFIDIIDEATDGNLNGHLNGGTEIAVVSFANNAVIDVPLSDTTQPLKEAIDHLEANGYTNHGDAFTKAIELLTPASEKNRIIVMFTDGKTTAGSAPAPIANAAKADNITIYCIGLNGENGIDEDALNSWATSPASEYVAIAPDSDALKEIFEKLAEEISKPGATEIVIHEMLNPEFVITQIVPPNKGTATQLSDTEIRWNIDQLGTVADESAFLAFYAMYTGDTSGDKEINESVTYMDAEQNAVTFPSPMVSVICNPIVKPDPCPEPINFTIDGSSDMVTYDLGDIYFSSLGNILNLDLTLMHVCPNRRIGLAVSVAELDDLDIEHQRVTKVFTVPAHQDSCCRNIKVKCLKFVMPDDLNLTPISPCQCRQRKFRVRVLHNYLDSNFNCQGCMEIPTII